MIEALILTWFVVAMVVGVTLLMFEDHPAFTYGRWNGMHGLKPLSEYTVGTIVVNLITLPFLLVVGVICIVGMTFAHIYYTCRIDLLLAWKPFKRRNNGQK